MRTHKDCTSPPIRLRFQFEIIRPPWPITGGTCHLELCFCHAANIIIRAAHIYAVHITAATVKLVLLMIVLGRVLDWQRCFLRRERVGQRDSLVGDKWV